MSAKINEWCANCHDINSTEDSLCFYCRSVYRQGFEAGKKSAFDWQPIETAPKDGTTIIGAGKGINRSSDAIFWSEGKDTYFGIAGWYEEGVRANMASQKPYPEESITRWIPLPSAPEEEVCAVNRPVKTVNLHAAKQICKDALKKEGQVWVLNPAEAYSKEVRFLFENFVGKGLSKSKRTPKQPVQICHTILDGIVSSLYAASDAEIERAGLVLSVLCETGVDLDFILTEVRTVILNLKSKGGQRYRLKDIATALMQRSHPDAIALGTEMLKLPLKFAYWVSYSSRQKFSIHALNPSNFSAENKTYTILAIFDFIDFMTGLMQMELGDVTPQVLVIDDLYHHISADSEILRRLMRNVAEALKTVNALVLISAPELDSSENNYQEVK